MKLSIPVPDKVVQYGRGLNGYHHKSGPKNVRFHFDDLALIDEEAAFLEIKPTALIRWLTMHCVQELHRIRTGETKEINP